MTYIWRYLWTGFYFSWERINPEEGTWHSLWPHSGTLSSGSCLSRWPAEQRLCYWTAHVPAAGCCILLSSRTSAPPPHWCPGRQTAPVWGPASARGPAASTGLAGRSGWWSDPRYPRPQGPQMSRQWSRSWCAPSPQWCSCCPQISERAACAEPPGNRSPPLHTRTQTFHAGWPPASELPSPWSPRWIPPTWVWGPSGPLGCSRHRCSRRGRCIRTLVSCSQSRCCRGWPVCLFHCTPDRESAGRSSSRWSRTRRDRSIRAEWPHWARRCILVPGCYLESTENKWRRSAGVSTTVDNRAQENKTKHTSRSIIHYLFCRGNNSFFESI